MLFDPKWNQPSVAGFKAWLERQRQDEIFMYSSCNTCAVAQYLHSVGSSWYDIKDVALLGELNLFAARACKNDNNFRPTFGDVLDEINKAGAA